MFVKAGGKYGMKMGFGDAEGRTLHGLVAESSGDIVLRLDRDGFIVHASENVEVLGHDLTSQLLMPHVRDLVEIAHAQAVADFVQERLAGNGDGGWIEFPVIDCKVHDDCSIPECRRWFALSVRVIEQADEETRGALGLLRSVQQKRVLEGELHARAVTDPLTGLANRTAFCASMQRHMDEGGEQAVAILAIDRMRSLFMQFGQRAADEIMWGFAKFLESMTLPGQELAQIDGERFGVILPGMTVKTARNWADDVLQTFSALTLPSSSRAPHLTASAGLAPIECTIDWTLQQAELALVMARAGGGMQVSQARVQQIGGLRGFNAA